MARIDLIRSLYLKDIPIDQFNFDNLRAKPLLYYLDPYVIHELNGIATSIRLQGNPKKKYEKIEKLLNPYGFRRITSGTNRAVFKHLDDQDIILKVALDSVGIKDSPAEFHNQNFLKPFVTKCFEVSPCGTVGLFERVQPIMKKREFISVSSDVFALLNKIIGQYILEDIGSNYFMNYGLREGFGPVLLDFPYMYELDGRRLHCGNRNPITGEICNGLIDYDDGFNNIVCPKCGKIYLATELEKNTEDNNIIIENGPSTKGEIHKMKIEIVKQKYDENGQVISENKVSETKINPETDHILPKEEVERTFKVNIERKRRPNILYNQRSITPDKKPHKVRRPRVGVTIVRPENKDLQKEQHISNQEEPPVVEVPQKVEYNGNLNDIIREAQQRHRIKTNPGILEANVLKEDNYQQASISTGVEASGIIEPEEVDQKENSEPVDEPTEEKDATMDAILDEY